MITPRQQAEAGASLILDLYTFRVTGKVGDGFRIVRELVARHGKVRRLMKSARGIRCEDDVETAISEITEDVYQYLSGKEFNESSAALRCANSVIGHRAIDYVVSQNKEQQGFDRAVSMVKASSAHWLDQTEVIDGLLDLKQGISRLQFAIPVHEFVWECLVNRHSYSIRELYSFLGVSYRQARHIHQTMSDFVKETVDEL